MKLGEYLDLYKGIKSTEDIKFYFFKVLFFVSLKDSSLWEKNSNSLLQGNSGIIKVLNSTTSNKREK